MPGSRTFEDGDADQLREATDEIRKFLRELTAPRRVSAVKGPKEFQLKALAYAKAQGLDHWRAADQHTFTQEDWLRLKSRRKNFCGRSIGGLAAKPTISARISARRRTLAHRSTLHDNCRCGHGGDRAAQGGPWSFH